MSNLKFVHSGGNSVSLTTPTSNPGSNVTFKLPAADGSAGQVLQTDGNGNLNWVSLPTGGLSMAQQWRLDTDSDIQFSGSYYLTQYWGVQDQAGAGNIGSSMTQSSGVFTFPSTGIYHIIFTAGWYESGGNARRATWGYIETTQDNGSSYTTASTVGSNSNGGTSGTTHANLRISTIFDVTDTSTHKCRFRVHSSNTINLWPNTANNITNAVFLRLGDT